MHLHPEPHILWILNYLAVAAIVLRRNDSDFIPMQRSKNRNDDKR